MFHLFCGDIKVSDMLMNEEQCICNSVQLIYENISSGSWVCYLTSTDSILPK